MSRSTTRSSTGSAAWWGSGSAARRRSIRRRSSRASSRARAESLPAVPHAGEVVGPASIRGALDALSARRIRHGIRAVDDPALVGELAERGVVLDVCPLSNVRTGAVASLAVHPLPQLVAAGVACTVSTDDPAMFDTDLTREYEAARALGVEPRVLYEAGVAGALCDDATLGRLREIGAAFDWSEAVPAAAMRPAP